MASSDRQLHAMVKCRCFARFLGRTVLRHTASSPSQCSWDDPGSSGRCLMIRRFYHTLLLHKTIINYADPSQSLMYV